MRFQIRHLYNWILAGLSFAVWELNKYDVWVVEVVFKRHTVYKDRIGS
jgi:hypothetical protein